MSSRTIGFVRAGWDAGVVAITLASIEYWLTPDLCFSLLYSFNQTIIMACLLPELMKEQNFSPHKPYEC